MIRRKLSDSGMQLSYQDGVHLSSYLPKFCRVLQPGLYKLTNQVIHKLACAGVTQN